MTTMSRKATTPKKRRVLGTCECCDPSCSGHDTTKGDCTKNATRKLFRPDWGDNGAYSYFCSKCADDATESGIFS